MYEKYHGFIRRIEQFLVIFVVLAMSATISTASFASSKTTSTTTKHASAAPHNKKTVKDHKKTSPLKKVKKQAKPSLYSTYCPEIGTPISSYSSQYKLPGIGKVCFDGFGTPHFQAILQPPVLTNIGKGQKIALIPYYLVGSPTLASANFIAVVHVPKKGPVKLTQILFLGFPLNPQDMKLHLKQKVSVALDASKIKRMIPTIPLTLLNNWIPRDSSFVKAKNNSIGVCAISQYLKTIPSSNRPYAEYRFNFLRQGDLFKLSNTISRRIINGHYLPCNKL